MERQKAADDESGLLFFSILNSLHQVLEDVQFDHHYADVWNTEPLGVHY